MGQVFYICGETASGKSDLALQVAEYLEGEIVNADVYQSYHGLEVLSAAPSAEDQAKVKHHLYGSFDLRQAMDAVWYAKQANEVIQEIQSRGKLPIVVGGSSLYLKFLTHGPSPAPPGDPALREELEREELSRLAARLQELDPEEAQRQNLQNRRHVTRALEICLLSGQKASDLRRNWENPELTNQLRGILLTSDQAELDDRMMRRSRGILQGGAIDEVRNLPPEAMTAAKAIGVTEIRALLAGESSEEETLQRLFFATRQYAKRQRNWFRKETWLTPISRQEVEKGDWCDVVHDLVRAENDRPVA